MDNQRINQLYRQNRRLQQQNDVLKQSLQQLIAVNTQLTQSIESFSNNNQNQMERINELQEQNKQLRNRLAKNGNQKQSDVNISVNKQKQIQELQNENRQMSNFIKQIVQSSKNAKFEYEKELQMMRNELEHSRTSWNSQINQIENRYRQKISEYQNIISNLKAKNQRMNQNFEKEVLKQSRQIQNEQIKNLKVSTTIEDLRNLYEKQLTEKDKTISIYTNLLKSLKQKIRS